ncbi:MAG: glycoside hydrolase domain-containing protein [Candidatus Omnitrophota bacterium]
MRKGWKYAAVGLCVTWFTLNTGQFLRADNQQLIPSGDFNALPQIPPVLNWNVELSGSNCALGVDENTGKRFLVFSANQGRIPPGQSANLTAPLLKIPSTEKFLVAVEARGKGMIRIRIFEYEGTPEKYQFARSTSSSLMALTPQWRWYFYECRLTDLAHLGKSVLSISAQPEEGQPLSAEMRLVSAREVKPTAKQVPVEDIPTTLVIPYLKPPAELTGDLKDPVWSRATHFTGFVDDKDPTKRLSPRRNEVFLFHDENALHIGLRSKNPVGKKLVTASRMRDSSMIYYDDNFEMGIVPDGLTVMYQFIVNAAGYLYDGTFDKTLFKNDWNGTETAAAKDADGYFCLEMRIPAKDMGLAEIRDGDIWRLTAVRNYRYEPIWFQDHLTPLKKGFADFERFARLRMAGDATAVDVACTGYASGRPFFSMALKNSAKESLFAGELTDIAENQALIPETVSPIPAGAAGMLAASLVYQENNAYRTDVRLEDTASDTPYAAMARDFSIARPLSLTADIDCVRQTMKVNINCAGLPAEEGEQLSGIIELEKKDDPNVLASAQISLSAGQESSVELPIGQTKDGIHLVDCTVRDGRGYLVAEAIEPVRMYKDMYWLNNGLGEEDVVPRPFTPPQYSEKEGVLSDRMHRVVLGTSVLPRQIFVGDTPLLAAPVEMTGVINGKTFRLSGELKRVNKTRKSSIEFASERNEDGIKSDVRLTFEYDGMLRVDVGLKGAKPMKLEKMQLSIPVRPEIADVLKNQGERRIEEGTTAKVGMLFLKDMEYAKEMYYTDVMGDGKESGFNKWNNKQFWPMIMLQNMDVGLCWFCESEENWSVGKDSDYFSLVKDAGKTELVVTVINLPVTVGSWKYTFGLQPFPGRPWDKAVEREMWGVRMEHYAEDAWGYNDMSEAAALHRQDANLMFVTNPPVGTFDIDNPYTRKMLIMDPWVVIHHAPDDADQRLIFRRVSDFWTRDNRRLFIYNNSSYTWFNSPEYKYFKNLWGMGGTPGQFWEWEMIEANRACRNWQDYWMYNFYHMLKRYPENFFSIDCSPVQCDDKEINGMGYTRNGKRYITYNIFETRRMYKRLYVVADELRENPIVLLSASGYWAPMTMSFCHITETGEEWRGWTRNQFEHPGRNLDYFRYSCASSIGPVRGFLPQVGYGTEREKNVHAEGIYLLHNLYFADVGMNAKFAQELYEVLKRIGIGFREDIAFHPYWKPMPAVTSGQKNFKISYWTRPGGAFLVLVNADWDHPSKGVISIDANALGVSAPAVSLFDPMINKVTPLQTAAPVKLETEIPAGLFQIILLENQDKK